MRSPTPTTIFHTILLLGTVMHLGVSTAAENSTVPMDKAEMEALYAVVEGFVGKGWNGREQYPDPCGWTAIQGVSCDLFDGKWFITSLSFGPLLENSLECSPHDAGFSPYLFQLRHLKSLSLFRCFSPSPTHHSAATIPPQNWENLAGSLESLEFRSNRRLVGALPPSLGKLASLRSLVLVDNGLAGAVPGELGNLVNLRKLVLSSNNFSGQVPASLGTGLNELLILDLSRNSLVGPLPPTIGGFSSLLKLDLSSNLIDGRLPEEIGALRKLTLLDLRSNRISGGLVGSIQNMVSLDALLLSDNPLGGTMSAVNWGNLSNLTTLDLSNSGLSGNIPESIAGLSSLRFLSLNNNQLLGTVPSKLALLPSINALYLNKNNLTGPLDFSVEFYDRVGKRFAAWGNPDLCYRLTGTGHVPAGLSQCKPGADSASVVGNGPLGRSSSPTTTTSSGASSAWGFFWRPPLVLVFIVFLFV